MRLFGMEKERRKMAKLHPENLRPVTKENAAERGRRGGIKAGETKRRKLEMKEAAKVFLDLAAKGKIAKNLEELGVEENDMTNQMAIIARAFSNAMSGDMKAMEFLRDTAGYTIPNNFGTTVNVSADSVQKAEIYIPDNGRGDSQ